MTSLMPRWYNWMRYHIVPPIFLVFFTTITQFMALIGKGEPPSIVTVGQNFLGNRYAWTVVAVSWAWAYASLRVSSRQHVGPPTLFGFRTVYQDNGKLYYCVTLVAYLLGHLWAPRLSRDLFDNMPQILGASNVVAILLCLLLWCKGKYCPEHEEDRMEVRPVPYEFYRGMEIHPRLLGVDVKQLTNCRLGIMSWQLLVVAFYLTGVELHGFNHAAFVNVTLQTVYIAKFFWWETGYFNTLDIILDRAGYYICWGCLVWVPCLYTFSSYYLVNHPPQLPTSIAVLIGVVGVVAIYLNYHVDREKQIFRENPDCLIWGQPAVYMIATFRDSHNDLHESKLLLSGSWGMARHLNYTFELLAAVSWCAPAFGLGSVWPFAYFLFLFALLVHRIYRDEEKCSQKYGPDWVDYCKRVPWRICPLLY